MYETIPVSDINRKALISFLAAALALLALCVGFLPVPFTVVLCYPPGIALGVVSLIYGIMSLREIRQHGKRGRRLALLAIWSGALMLVMAICMITAGVLLWPRVVELFQQTFDQLKTEAVQLAQERHRTL